MNVLYQESTRCDQWVLHEFARTPLDGVMIRDIIIFMELNMIERTETNTGHFDQQVQILKVFTHPARIAILEILRGGEHCVCHMEAHLGFRQSYISQQLAVLREAGFIQDRRDGWNIYYRVINPQIYEVLDAVVRITGQDKASILGTGNVCNCPHCSSHSGK